MTADLVAITIGAILAIMFLFMAIPLGVLDQVVQERSDYDPEAIRQYEEESDREYYQERSTATAPAQFTRPFNRT